MLKENLEFFRKLKNIVDFIGSTPEKQVKVYAYSDDNLSTEFKLSDFILNNDNIYEFVYTVFNFYSNKIFTTICFELPDGSKISTLLETTTWEEVNQK